MTPHEIMAKILAEHMPKPSHNLLARQIAKDLKAAGYVIVSKQEYEDAMWGHTRLASGGYLSRTDWPR